MKLLLAALLIFAGSIRADEFKAIWTGGAMAINQTTGQPTMFRKGDIISDRMPGAYSPRGLGWAKVYGGPHNGYVPDPHPHLRGFPPYATPFVAAPVPRVVIFPSPLIGFPPTVVVITDRIHVVRSRL